MATTSMDYEAANGDRYEGQHLSHTRKRPHVPELRSTRFREQMGKSRVACRVATLARFDLR